MLTTGLMGPQMHKDLADKDECEVTINEDGTVEVRTNDPEMLAEVMEMLEEMGITMQPA